MTSFQHKKSLGQHFLNSPVVPGWLCDAGEVTNGDVVLEIGPGTGALTAELLSRGAQVAAIEADSRAIETLKERFSDEIASGQLRVAEGDMRELSAEAVAKIFDFGDHEYKLVANIPYYLSGHLFRTFLETEYQPTSLIFLVQKEIAARIARDEKESILSLSVKAFGTPKYVKTVTKGHFTPSPKVDSAIIAISDIHRDNFADFTEIERFFVLLHLGLGQKRKQLLGILSKTYGRAEIEAMFEELSIPLTARGEDIELTQWLQLTHRLSTV